MKLSLGFSPCPNDTFIFDALVHGKIDTEGLEFEIVLADVEELNLKAFRKELDITKISFHALGHLLSDYALLWSGAALGNNCGPLLISKKEISPEEVKNCSIAIPGQYTTANFLMSLAFPEAKNKVEVLFSDIEKAVLSGEVDAGLIIHENRFTYHERGLQKIMDLGEYWETATQKPIPLGGIAIQRKQSKAIQEKFNRVLKRSIAYAFEHPEGAMNYVRKHAQEMEESVMRAHIDLYVNDFSLDLKGEGAQAVAYLYQTALEKNIIPAFHENIFI